MMNWWAENTANADTSLKSEMEREHDTKYLSSSGVYRMGKVLIHSHKQAKDSLLADTLNLMDHSTTSDWPFVGSEV